MPNNNQKALITIGSNEDSVFGNVRETVQKAMECLANLSSGAVSRSRFYSTPAFPPGAGPDFVNAAIAITTDQPAVDLLGHLHNIETQAERRRSARWAPRTLDLDLIALGQEVIPDVTTYAAWRDLPMDQQQSQSPDQLILPHPRMQDRAFVLVPLADIAPDWEHPVLRQSVSALLKALPHDQIASVRVLSQT